MSEWNQWNTCPPSRKMVIVGRYNQPDGWPMYAVGLYEPDRNYIPFGDGGEDSEIAYDLPDEWMSGDDFAVVLYAPAHVTEEEFSLKLEITALKRRIAALETALDEIRLIARSVLPSEEVIADHQAHWNGKELYQIAKKAEAALKKDEGK